MFSARSLEPALPQANSSLVQLWVWGMLGLAIPGAFALEHWWPLAAALGILVAGLVWRLRNP